MKALSVERQFVSCENETYFIGANSENGFIKSQDERLSEKNCEKVLVIKGGPGTGKSTLIRRAASYAESIGMGSVEFFCSSDPSSADAVSISSSDGRFLIIDGTSPHCVEPLYPGAISETEDISRFWDLSVLENEKARIMYLCDRKKELFDDAKKLQNAAASLRKSADEASYYAFDNDKIKAYTERILSNLPIRKGEKRNVFTSAFSMKGTVTLDTNFRKADTVYTIDDTIGFSRVFLRELTQSLEERDADFECEKCPFDSEICEAVYINSARVLFTSLNNESFDSKTIRHTRFQTENASLCRGAFRLYEKCRKSLLDSAQEALRTASDVHFELEEIYSSSMDFKASEASFMKKITDRLEKYS